MSEARPSFHILIVQAWTIDVTPCAEALRAAGIDAALTRVDFRAALEAALAHQRFDLVIVDPSTTDLPRGVVEECLARAGREIKIIPLAEPARLAEHVVDALAARRN